MEPQANSAAERMVSGSPTRWRDRAIGWTVLAVLAVVFIGNGFLNPIFMFNQMLAWYSVSATLIFSWVCVAAIALALVDIHPAKRVMLFLVLPCTLFGILYCVGIETGRIMVSTGPPFRELSQFIFVTPLFCVSVGWLLWLLRVLRDWRFTTKLQAINNSQNNRWRELVCLGLVIALAVALAAAGWGGIQFTPILFAAGGVLAIVLIAPITFWLMRTRRPGLLWLLIGVGIPVLNLIGFILFQFQHYWQSGILVTEEAKMATGLMVAVVSPLVTFLAALRLLEFQLVYSKPWTSPPKIVTQATKPHPLDD